ncbi:MAG: ATP-binding protein [Bacteroidales bacterium]|nr:ATP-binding protein [Bacteroidales bacterium]MBD5209104.1 ATP-binding protein [Bacteroidales bacterium]
MTDLNLITYMNAELRRTPTAFHRYMYDRILWEDRMIGLVGPRGVGKSTMMKQHILLQPDRERWLYVSADNSYFYNHTLIELADEWVKENGVHLVIDEVHKYNGWSRELKQIYDTFSDLQVIFTGSSVLDIHQGAADLSRRALIFEMQGLSFREYLKLTENIDIPVYSLDEILQNRVEFPLDFHPLPYFKEYLARGYYPFSSQPGYELRLQQVMNQTLEVDIPQYAGMNISTSRKLARLLALLSESVPYKPNMGNLTVELKVSKNDLPDYLVYLEKAGMIAQLRDETGGFRGLGKLEKIFLDNPNLMYALRGDGVNIGSVRETFFYNQMRVNHEVVAAKTTDFRIGDYVFEVGGAKKGRRQLEGDPNGIVVRDDIEFGHANIIPLWHYGLNY